MRDKQPVRTFRRLLYLFLIFRLTLVAVTVSNPTGSLMVDSPEYLALAAELVETGNYGIPSDPVPELFRPPAYAGLLAIIQQILGPATYNITFIQLVLSSLTSLLILSLGTQLSKLRAGLFGAWLYAISPNVALWSLTIMTEVAFAFGLTLIAWLSLIAAKRSLNTWSISSGMQLGLLAYLRPIGMVLLAAWSMATFLGSRARIGKRRAIAAAGVLMVAGLLIILPWAYRNWATHRIFAFSTITTNSWVGFNLAEVVARGEGIDRNQAVGLLDPEVAIFQLTLDVFKSYPIEFVEAQALGIIRTAAGTEIGTWGFVLDGSAWRGFGLLSNRDQRSFGEVLIDAIGNSSGDDRTGLALNVYSLLFSLILIGLAAIGILTFRASDMPERLIFWSAATSVLILLLIPGAVGQARFRVPAEPYLALLAGYGWLALSVRFRSKQKSLDRLDTQEEFIHAS